MTDAERIDHVAARESELAALLREAPPLGMADGALESVFQNGAVELPFELSSNRE